ncbi:MAG: hypothetical protein Q9223_004421, partial [Gallowayella weberi]
MIHSSRQARPTSTLRRTASATPSFNTSAADFSKQFNFQHLLNSPLPSPALPSIIPRHGKKPTSRPIRNAVRIFARFGVYLCGIAIFYWSISLVRHLLFSPTSVTYLSLDVDDYNVAPQDHTALEAAPVVIADVHRKPKWTVSIPRGVDFPLKPSQYAQICAQSEDIVQQLHSSSGHGHLHTSSSEFHRTATGFVDVQEAHDQGLLSSPTANQDQLDAGSADIEGPVEAQRHAKAQIHDGRKDSGICRKSLTFVMESTDAGLGKTLLGLWMAFGLAQEEGRTFFIDDSNWAYGEYTTFFKPPPTPSCRPPPPTQRLPCPHQTRHLVVSTATYRWVFGDLMEPLSYDHHSQHKVARQQRAFSLARAGHDALFHLTGADADYLSTRLADLDSTSRSRGGLTIGLHVRRGDRHPWERQYSDSYIPYSTYGSSAQSLLTAAFNPSNVTTPSPEAQTRLSASKILLASDDPETYTAPEFSSLSTELAQSHILLANKAALDAALPKPGPVKPPTEEPAFIKFVEPNVGWEGGFFASIFWGLGNAAEGRAAARGTREERPSQEPNEESRRLR